MAIRFPNDCPKDCKYFVTWDMSVDDWTNVCNKGRMQVDDCDTDYVSYPCPLETEKTGAVNTPVS